MRLLAGLPPQLLRHTAAHSEEVHPPPSFACPGVNCIGVVALWAPFVDDEEIASFSNSEFVLEHAHCGIF